jgi:L-lactate utilization protein LutB
MEKTDKEQKAEIIKAFTEAIDKNTSSMRDVWCIIHALQDGLEFMEDKRYKYRTDLPYCIRGMRENLKSEEHGIKMLFDDITDDLQELIMLAGENAEGLIVINSKSMREDLHNLSDEYNS